jgi:hypothetical protein
MEYFALRQLRLQCKFYQLAHADLKEALFLYRLGQSFADARIWCDIQNMLTAAANIAKVLWGTSKNPQTRAIDRDLGNWLNVPDTCALRDVRMKNNLEHFDERIDYWAQLNRVHIADLYIDILPNDLGSNPGIWRFFDSKAMQLTFSGKVLDLNAVTAEIALLAARVYEELDKDDLTANREHAAS